MKKSFKKPVEKKGGEKSPPFNISDKPLMGQDSSKSLAKKEQFKPQGELAEFIQAATKKHSDKTFRFGNEDTADYGRIRTGILALDLCLAGGFMYGRVCMLYGEKSAGKSTVALLTASQALKDNPNSIVVYVDLEGTFDKNWAVKLGVPLDRIMVVTPDTGEEAVDLTDGIIRVASVCMVIIDSVAVLIPHKEIEGSAADAHVGIQARLVGTFLRRINSAVIRERKRGHHVLLMPLNQFRTKIGVMFGDNRTLPGGKALEFYTSQQVLLTNKEHRSEKGEDKGFVTYNEHGISITKDKTVGRIKEGKFKLIRDESSGFPAGYVDQSKTVLTIARQVGLYTGAGTRHTLEGVGTFASHEEIGKFFFENPDKLYDFNTKIIDYYRNLWGVS